MEESRFRGYGLYDCFVDFKKVFDMVPHEHLWEHLWRCIEELEVPNEYTLPIARIHEKVIRCVHMGNEMSIFFQYHYYS